MAIKEIRLTMLLFYYIPIQRYRDQCERYFNTRHRTFSQVARQDEDARFGPRLRLHLVVIHD